MLVSEEELLVFRVVAGRMEAGKRAVVSRGVECEVRGQLPRSCGRAGQQAQEQEAPRPRRAQAVTGGRRVTLGPEDHYSELMPC